MHRIRPSRRASGALGGGGSGPCRRTLSSRASSSRLDGSTLLERIALQDDYFVQRKLYPNVDSYSGLIYQALGFPVDMFPVLFAIPRTSGWLARWLEMPADAEQKIALPRQLYVGPSRRDFVPVDGRQRG